MAVETLFCTSYSIILSMLACISGVKVLFTGGDRDLSFKVMSTCFLLRGPTINFPWYCDAPISLIHYLRFVLVTFPAATTIPLKLLIIFLRFAYPSIAVLAKPDVRILSNCRLFKTLIA